MLRRIGIRCDRPRRLIQSTRKLPSLFNAAWYELRDCQHQEREQQRRLIRELNPLNESRFDIVGNFPSWLESNWVSADSAPSARCSVASISPILIVSIISCCFIYISLLPPLIQFVSYPTTLIPFNFITWFSWRRHQIRHRLFQLQMGFSAGFLRDSCGISLPCLCSSASSNSNLIETAVGCQSSFIFYPIQLHLRPFFYHIHRHDLRSRCLNHRNKWN